MTQEQQILQTLRDRLQAASDNAYINYIDCLRRDECLGWEIKVEHGRFGEAEMKAHRIANQELGRHRAFAAAAKMVVEELDSITSRQS